MSGIQGYSTPTENVVFFSISDKMSGIWNAIVCNHEIIRSNVKRFVGCYKGKQEPSYCLPEEIFWLLHFNFPYLFSDQESVLHLGTPQARNWRPAKLIFMHDKREVSIGVWLSATQEQAYKAGNYTYCPVHDLYWVCEVDPPANDFERKERRKKAAVERVVSFMDSCKYAFLTEDFARMAKVKQELMEAFEWNGH